MLSYPAQKKWTLIQSDALQEYDLERKRATIGPDGDRSAPEWYVRKIVDGSISMKELGSLSVSLRTQPNGWVKRFLDTQGMIALVKVLNGLSSKGIKNETDVQREYEIVKCLKTLLNNKVPLPSHNSLPRVAMETDCCIVWRRCSYGTSCSGILIMFLHCEPSSPHSQSRRRNPHLSMSLGPSQRPLCRPLRNGPT